MALRKAVIKTYLNYEKDDTQSSIELLLNFSFLSLHRYIEFLNSFVIFLNRDKEKFSTLKFNVMDEGVNRKSYHGVYNLEKLDGVEVPRYVFLYVCAV